MTVRQIRLEVSDGTDLEAEVALPADGDAACPIVTLAHPHPLRGGSMDAGIIDVLFRALPDHGIAAIRWNFRGVGTSTGTHDEGRAERLDVTAAVEHAIGLTTGPVIAAGWSFGADVSTAVDHDRLAAWILIAPPLRLVAADDMVCAASSKPTLALVAEHDQFNPPDTARPVIDEWAVAELTVVPQTDHFLAGAGAMITNTVVAFVEDVAANP